MNCFLALLSNLGKALVTCGQDGANLVPLRTCDDLDGLQSALKVGLFPEDMVYRVGIFGFLDDPAATRYLPGPDFLVDSTGIPIDESALSDLTAGLCGAKTAGLGDVDDDATNNFGVYLKYAGMETSHESIEHPYSTGTQEQGFVCERDGESGNSLPQLLF